MTRTALCVTLGTLALVVGLVTCVVQSSNHARARRLAELQRQWEMLDAANAQSEATAAAHVWGRRNEELTDAGGDSASARELRLVSAGPEVRQ